MLLNTWTSFAPGTGLRTWLSSAAVCWLRRRPASWASCLHAVAPPCPRVSLRYRSQSTMMLTVAKRRVYCIYYATLSIVIGLVGASRVVSEEFLEYLLVKPSDLK